MAKYRQIHVTFWRDTFVSEELTPEERYFYMYLLTNSETTQCGIYEFSMKIAGMELGFTREVVEKYMERFIAYGKIKYSEKTKEIMLQNWCKWNWSNSPKVQMCIKKELENVKNPLFVKDYIEQVRGAGYSIDTLSIDSGEKEKEKEKKTLVQIDDFAPQSAPAVKKTKTSKTKTKTKTAKTKSQSTYPPEFETFWSIYPRKTDKKLAYTKFLRCLKDYELEDIIKGTKGYILDIKRNRTETKFIKHPKTFLHNDSFLDFLEDENKKASTTKQMPAIGQLPPQRNEEDTWTNTQDTSSTKSNGSNLL